MDEGTATFLEAGAVGDYFDIPRPQRLVTMRPERVMYGTDFPNKIKFLEVVKPERLVYEHGGRPQLTELGDPGAVVKHRPWCKAKKKMPDQQPMCGIHLYREVTSEALRVLLPLAMLDTEVKLPNLSAALTLGLRRFFGGDPQAFAFNNENEDRWTFEARLSTPSDSTSRWSGEGIIA